MVTNKKSMNPAELKEQVEREVGELLEKAVSLSGKTQTAIASEVGFKRPNIISMMIRGQARLPLTKVAAFAHSVGMDPAHLARIVFAGYEPELWEMLTKWVFKNQDVTSAEMRLVKAAREACGNDAVTPTPEQLEQIKAIFAAK
ncbi:hypothetical protein ACODYM_29485 [Burkholderia gladioli]|uniref:hypothetical protein n=1 Tax=Burkholderia gladioli TaxID=28095 RepID=UPI003B50F665